MIARSVVLSPKGRAGPHTRPGRRGFILLLVILTIIGAMALGYSVLRISRLHLRIVRNTALHQKAIAAVDSGLSVAFRNMFSPSWGGVGTILVGSCGPDETFEVRYLPGDETLSPTDPEYGRLPYRVTLRGVGKAWLPGESDYPSEYRKTWVVELVPRAVAPEPTDWPTIQQYTLYQTLVDVNRFNIPCQVAGPARFQGSVRVAPDYPPTAARERYLSDLYAMKQAGYPDYRPFTETLRWYPAVQTPDDLLAVTTWLGLSTISLPPQVVNNDLKLLSGLSSYQLYRGGPTYSVPELSGSIANTSLNADPLNNPCGIFFRSGSMIIGDNVQLTGTIICTGDVTIAGSNILLRAAPLQSPWQAYDSMEIPVLVCRSLRFEFGLQRQIQGFVGAFGEFQVKKNDASCQLLLEGKIFAQRFRIDPRTPWDTFDWDKKLAQFELQRPTATGDDKYFPLWLRQFGLYPEPRIVLKTRPSAVGYHWKTETDPIYVPAARDTTPLEPQPGLRWKIVRIVEQ